MKYTNEQMKLVTVANRVLKQFARQDKLIEELDKAVEAGPRDFFTLVRQREELTARVKTAEKIFAGMFRIDANILKRRFMPGGADLQAQASLFGMSYDKYMERRKAAARTFVEELSKIEGWWNL